MRNVVSRSFTTLAVLALALVGLNAQFKPAQRMPATASEYARLVEPELGMVPTIDCVEGVRVPIHVDGVEVFHDQEGFACDNPDFKGGCNVGSRVNRLEGRDATGAPMTDVVWVYLCRSSGVKWFEQGIVSVQMIGHNTRTGATAFFEAPDADPSRPNPQPDLLRFDENGILDGEFPGPDDPAFDEAFRPRRSSARTATRPTRSFTTLGSTAPACRTIRTSRSSRSSGDQILPTTLWAARTGTAARSTSRATAAPPATACQTRPGSLPTARMTSTTSCPRTLPAAWRRTTPRSARATTRVRKQLPSATGSSRRHGDTPTSGAVGAAITPHSCRQRQKCLRGTPRTRVSRSRRPRAHG